MVPQIKGGSPITLIQLIISVVVLLGGGVGLYVKNAVQLSNLEVRLEIMEKGINQNAANLTARTLARNQQVDELKEKIGKNSEDINIIKAQLQYLRR